MNSNASSVICAATCWGIGLVAGTLIAVLLMVMGDWMVIQALFVGGIAFLIAGGVLSALFCRALPRPGEVKAVGAHTPAAAPKPAAPKAATPKPAAPRENPAPATAPGAAPAAAPVATTAPATTAPAAPAAPAPLPADDGVKPEGLSAARGGQPDDLKMIKGVGPKLEQQLHSLGYYHFDQIANWTPSEVAWVDENLQGFKGRVSRDNWVEQASLLAAGGETEFSKKVGKGDVY